MKKGILILIIGIISFFCFANDAKASCICPSCGCTAYFECQGGMLCSGTACSYCSGDPDCICIADNSVIDDCSCDIGVCGAECVTNADCPSDGNYCIDQFTEGYRDYFCSESTCTCEYIASIPFDCRDLNGCNGQIYEDHACDGGNCKASQYDCSLANNWDGDGVACNCDCGCYDQVEEKGASCNSIDVCSDGIDNDCDGVIDIYDTGCSDPPVALINCNTSGCGTPSCVGYGGYGHSCVVILDNDTTDPDLPPTAGDMITFEWDILDYGIIPDDPCGPTQDPSSCFFTPGNWFPVPSPQSFQDYTIQLTATDLAGNTSIDTIDYRHRRNAVAGFRCSMDENPDWNAKDWSIECADLNIPIKEYLFLKDDLPDPYEKSFVSYGGSNIIQRIWKIRGVEFDTANNSETSIMINAYNAVVELEVVDDNPHFGGQRGTESHGVPAIFNAPQWREVPAY